LNLKQKLGFILFFTFIFSSYWSVLLLVAQSPDWDLKTVYKFRRTLTATETFVFNNNSTFHSYSLSDEVLFRIDAFNESSSILNATIFDSYSNPAEIVQELGTFFINYNWIDVNILSDPETREFKEYRYVGVDFTVFFIPGVFPFLILPEWEEMNRGMREYTFNPARKIYSTEQFSITLRNLLDDAVSYNIMGVTDIDHVPDLITDSTTRWTWNLVLDGLVYYDVDSSSEIELNSYTSYRVGSTLEYTYGGTLKEFSFYIESANEEMSLSSRGSLKFLSAKITSSSPGSGMISVSTLLILSIFSLRRKKE